jgi:hypothetical protein
VDHLFNGKKFRHCAPENLWYGTFLSTVSPCKVSVWTFLQAKTQDLPLFPHHRGLTEAPQHVPYRAADWLSPIAHGWGESSPAWAGLVTGISRSSLQNFFFVNIISFLYRYLITFSVCIFSNIGYLVYLRSPFAPPPPNPRSFA